MPETPVEFLFPGTDTTPRIDCNPRLLVSFIPELATLCLYIMRFFLAPVADSTKLINKLKDNRVNAQIFVILFLVLHKGSTPTQLSGRTSTRE